MNTSTLEDRLWHAGGDIQMSTIPDWIDPLCDDENPKRPDEELWEDWAWEIATWCHSSSHQDRSYYLHPVTNIVQGLTLEYIPEQEAERISSEVMEGFHTIEAENCVLHNDTHTRSIVLREKDLSAIIIDFGQAIVCAPGRSLRVMKAGWALFRATDMRFIRKIFGGSRAWRVEEDCNAFRDSSWRYEKPVAFNRYVESMPEDFRRATFERRFPRLFETILTSFLTPASVLARGTFTIPSSHLSTAQNFKIKTILKGGLKHDSGDAGPRFRAENLKRLCFSFRANRRTSSKASTGCSLEEGLKEMMMIEKTAMVRMSPTLFHQPTPQARDLALERCSSKKKNENLDIVMRSEGALEAEA
ncbi:hypothetical protein IW261DRAFT_1596690 [Armillaria novae-zelandiae]|uniref:Protein kinase domain-containing protein n=1 Tax=Armillaria novae-zelandiae TaxID=153914 RepID=A0AA39U279_9AGAR|nr:hypothetical protein IW261DRAFT_1596690 [Armillaria novae-zelandiae]